MSSNPVLAKKKNSEFYEWIKSLAIACVIAMLVRIFLFEMVVVQQTSMRPTLQENDKVCVLKSAYLFSAPKRGDIIIIKIDESTNYVKRVIAFGGERVKIENSAVYINGQLLDEPYLTGELEYRNFSEVVVPEGKYFVLGDNRPSSIDSRYASVGYIEKSAIRGKALLRLHPFKVF